MIDPFKKSATKRSMTTMSQGSAMSKFTDMSKFPGPGFNSGKIADNLSEISRDESVQLDEDDAHSPEREALKDDHTRLRGSVKEPDNAF